MTVVCLGAHILDVLGRPVTDIPSGQGRRVLDEIRVTAAGTAGGTAVDLAKLGVEVASIGPVGDDTTGRLLRTLLAEHGVDTSGLAPRPGAATPATMLPVRPNGERPALHAPGAMGSLTADDVDLDLVAAADALHVGGPDVLGAFTAEALPGVLAHARAHDTLVTTDLLSVPRPGLLDEFANLWPLIDVFLPNDDQLRLLTGLDDLQDAAGLLRRAGVGTVIVTCGGDGALVVSDAVVALVPAHDVPVVDTTGCGDAFTAGYLTGRLRGEDLLDAVRLGNAAAALVAGGLGSDAGIVDLSSTLDLRDRHVGRAPPGPDTVRRSATAPAPEVD
ncbi:carbohydrate kinase family protein [Pseudonocardia sp. KRD291]|uniref:carbohydrate kinase family protein n=1 Tax=Pseudonocardia sp. KRD291 TaxID=2792007 RepID=UPI001C5C7800|nr:carbohydrate kinase family protein [Pseudonocardia sp. KRD291]MBW0102072.1 carbohydrate kinase family protein [Pseudonocardia sp. KRD291]